MPRLRFGFASLLAMLWFAGDVVSQPLVPLGDNVEEPLLPTGISHHPVEMFGVLHNRWKEPDGTDLVHFIGDFELHMGRRRLRAREAVIWVTPQRYEGKPYVQYEVYLWRDAQVTEPAGTFTSGPVLFVTLNSSGKLSLSSDRVGNVSTDDSPVYREATQLRTALRARPGQPLAPQAPGPVEVVGPDAQPKPAAKPRPAFGYRSPNPLVMGDVDGQPIVTVNNIYAFQGSANDLLELRADSAVLFLKRGAMGSSDPSPQTQPQPGEGPAAPRLPLGALAGEDPAGDRQGLLPGGDVESVYLEGDVVLTRGERMIRADKLFYDLENDKALILDAVLRATVPDRNIPIYVRADEIRQLNREQYVASKARVSTSEFYTPHYHVGAEKVDVTDRTPRSASGEALGLQAGTFAMRHATFNVEGVPVTYWPYLRGDFKEGVSPLESFRLGYSDDFGAEIESEWQLFNLLGIQSPFGFDAKLRLDYYTERGPAAGINLDYERDTYFGLLRTYYINDHGEDSLGRYRDQEPDSENRGRVTWRHRQYLPNDWELTLELSYISDRGFLEEYFEREFEDGKDQETLIYLKKQEKTWAFTGLAQWRILDWYTQTERLPDFSFRVIAQPIGDRVTWFSENRLGFVRYRPAERGLAEDFAFYGGREHGSGNVERADSRQEFDTVLRLGNFTVVPFGSIRGSTWDDSPGGANAFQAPGSGNVGRVLGTYGFRGSGYASRVFPNIQSDLLDIHGIRHVIKPEVTAWLAHTNLDSYRLYPFDETVEAIDEIDGASVGVRQRWQAKRGGPGRQRIVDVFVLDLEAGAFNDVQPYETTRSGRGLFDRKRGARTYVRGAQSDETTYGYTSWSRPENSVARNYASAAGQWRISDTTALLSEANFDLNDGTLDVFNFSYAVERTPRLSYVIGYRYINEIDSNLLGAGLNYKISEKHTFAVREQFDLDRGETAEFSIAFIRKLPRWYLALSFDLDEVDDDFGVSLSAWPEGLPRATLGSRRYTGLAESTGIRPE